jgi:cytidylate kinase
MGIASVPANELRRFVSGHQAMPEHLSQPRDRSTSAPEVPRHGYRGDRAPAADHPFLPASVTVALSREAGSRGTSIAKRAGEKLGWQVYSQELLEYIAQEATVRADILGNLSPAANHWVEEQLERVQNDYSVHRHPPLLDMAGIILALGATGEAILIGRGAGCLLPRHATLHVRVVAPLEDRVAYMSQWLRLTVDEAGEQVRLRDQRRAEFLQTHFGRDADDVYQYDLLLNSTLLGEDLCADLLVQAARAKAKALLAG